MTRKISLAALSPTSQELVLMADCDTGELRVAADYTARDFEEFKQRCRDEFWNTPTGEELLERFGDREAEILPRLVEIFQQRFSANVPYPGLPITERWVECARDLLNAELQEPEAPKPQATKRAPTEDELFADLVVEAKRDIFDDTMSTVAINEKRQNRLQYERAWRVAMTETVPQPAKPEAPAEVKSFAHLLNEHIGRHGVPRPAAGFVTVIAGSRDYKYPLSEFRRLSDSAAEHGLIQ
jgi:hypothetical protein